MNTILFNLPGTQLEFSRSSRIYPLSPAQKKDARFRIAADLPPEYIPLHASVITKDGFTIAITGASKSGKTTLSEMFIKSGYKCVANDFVILWQEGKKLMGADLNYSDVNANKTPLSIDLILVLTPDDVRDVYRLNRHNLTNFYVDSLTPMSLRKLDVFSKSAVFDAVYAKHIALGNRQSPKRTHDIISTTIRSMPLNKVGVIGVGTVGQDISNLLLTQSWAKELHLYSPNLDKTKSIAKDLSSATTDIKVEAHADAQTLINETNSLVLTFNSHRSDLFIPNIEERRKKLFLHASIIWELSRYIRKAKYKGIIVVVTNPVDLLSWCMYYFSNLDDNLNLDWGGLSSHQVVGIGLGLDVHRLKTITTKNYDLVGEHGDGLLLVKNTRQGTTIVNNKKLLESIKTFSTDIRKHTERTRFGPSHDILRVMRELSIRSGGIIRYSTLSSDSCFLGIPTEICKYGVPKEAEEYAPQLRQSRELLVKEHIAFYANILSKLNEIKDY